jgi:hypothetical protein
MMHFCTRLKPVANPPGNGSNPSHGSRAFSKDDANNEVPVAYRLSDGVLAQHIEQLLKPFATEIPVVFADHIIDVTQDANNAGLVAQGMTFNGKIYLFRNGLKNTADVSKTLWHELLHFGLRRFMTQDQYVQELNKLYAKDAWIREKAKAFVASGEGEELKSHPLPRHLTRLAQHQLAQKRSIP